MMLMMKYVYGGLYVVDLWEKTSFFLCGNFPWYSIPWKIKSLE